MREYPENLKSSRNAPIFKRIYAKMLIINNILTVNITSYQNKDVDDLRNVQTRLYHRIDLSHFEHM